MKALRAEVYDVGVRIMVLRDNAPCGGTERGDIVTLQIIHESMQRNAAVITTPDDSVWVLACRNFNSKTSLLACLWSWSSRASAPFPVGYDYEKIAAWHWPHFQ